MAEITVISEQKMTNDIHYLFNKNVSERALADEAVMKNTKHLKPMAEVLAEAVKTEDQYIAVSRKSFNTDEITALDKRRDNAYSAFKMQVRTYMKVSAEPMRNAAAILDQVISTYNISVNMQLDKETSRLMNLLDDLTSKYSEQIATLNLGLFVTEMSEANQALIECTDQRTEERMETKVGAMKDARNAVDAAYHKLVKYVNAYALITEDEAYDNFISYVNAEIKHFKELMARSGGEAKPDKEDTVE